MTLYELVEFLLSFEGPEESGGLIIRRHAPILSQIPGPVKSFLARLFVVACLYLEECVCLLLRDQPGIPQGPQEALALLNVRGTEIPRIVDEIIHQVIMFRSNQAAPCILQQSTDGKN